MHILDVSKPKDVINFVRSFDHSLDVLVSAIKLLIKNGDDEFVFLGEQCWVHAAHQGGGRARTGQEFCHERSWHLFAHQGIPHHAGKVVYFHLFKKHRFCFLNMQILKSNEKCPNKKNWLAQK